MAFGYAVTFVERGRNRVIRWEPDSGAIDVVAGECKDPDPSQKLRGPYGLAVGKDGDLLISDKPNDRICRLRNGRLETVQVKDTDGHRNPLPTSARGYHPRLLCPAGLFMRRNGVLLCAYYNDLTIYAIHPDGRLELVLGVTRNHPYFITTMPEVVPPSKVKDTPINQVTGLVERSDGTIFFTERRQQVVYEYHPSRGIRSLFPFSKRHEYFNGRPAPAETTVSDYYSPYPASLSLDSDETLYIAEAIQGCLLALDQKASKVRKVVESKGKRVREGVEGIDAVTFGPDGTAWVVDGGAASILAYSPLKTGMWKPIGPALQSIRGEPLSFRRGGCGIVAG